MGNALLSVPVVEQVQTFLTQGDMAGKLNGSLSVSLPLIFGLDCERCGFHVYKMVKCI